MKILIVVTSYQPLSLCRTKRFYLLPSFVQRTVAFAPLALLEMNKLLA
jgi:hypothetical protein